MDELNGLGTKVTRRCCQCKRYVQHSLSAAAARRAVPLLQDTRAPLQAAAEWLPAALLLLESSAETTTTIITYCLHCELKTEPVYFRCIFTKCWMFFRQHRITTYMNAAYCYRWSSVVCQSLRLSCQGALQKPLKRSRCCPGCGLGWAQGTLMGSRSDPHAKGQFCIVHK